MRSSHFAVRDRRSVYAGRNEVGQHSGDARNRAEGQKGRGGGAGLAGAFARGEERGRRSRAAALLPSPLCAGGEAGRDGAMRLRPVRRSTWSSAIRASDQPISGASRSPFRRSTGRQCRARSWNASWRCCMPAGRFSMTCARACRRRWQKGPRGGGKNRDRIVRHTLISELDMAKKLGLREPQEMMLTEEGLRRTATTIAVRSGRSMPRKDGAKVAAPLPHPPHRVSHDGSCLGNGRQGPDRQTSMR